MYLEIQWWFVKAPEPSDSEEDIDAQEVQGNLSLSLCALFLSRAVRVLLQVHPLIKEIRASNLHLRCSAQATYFIKPGAPVAAPGPLVPELF